MHFRGEGTAGCIVAGKESVCIAAGRSQVVLQQRRSQRALYRSIGGPSMHYNR